MVSDMENNERESMQQGKYEEGIACPTMEHLDLLMCDTSQQRDPVGLARGSAAGC